MDIIIKPTETSKPELQSLVDTKDRSVKQYKAPQVKLSDNIQSFDEKVKKVQTKNPYEYNTISLKEKDSIPSTPTAFAMITDPLYNQVGKILGVDTLHEWGLDYDKVFEIVELAKKKSKLTDTTKLASWILNQLNYAPSLGGKRLNDVHVYLKVGVD